MKSGQCDTEEPRLSGPRLHGFAIIWTTNRDQFLFMYTPTIRNIYVILNI